MAMMYPSAGALIGYFRGLSVTSEPLTVPMGMMYWWSVGVTCESCTRPIGTMSSIFCGSRGKVFNFLYPVPSHCWPNNPTACLAGCGVVGGGDAREIGR